MSKTKNQVKRERRFKALIAKWRKAQARMIAELREAKAQIGTEILDGRDVSGAEFVAYEIIARAHSTFVDSHPDDMTGAAGEYRDYVDEAALDVIFKVASMHGLWPDIERCWEVTPLKRDLETVRRENRP